MNTNQNATVYESVPMVSELNKVQGFDPLKFLHKTSKGEKSLDLKYKKLWFRLKYPNGRIKLSALKITEQLAIIEARVYFDKNDAEPRASFIAQREAKSTPGGLYIELAQHAAIDQALSDAGFGVQFTAADSGKAVGNIPKAAAQSPSAETETTVNDGSVAKAPNSAVCEPVVSVETSGSESVQEPEQLHTDMTAETTNENRAPAAEASFAEAASHTEEAEEVETADAAPAENAPVAAYTSEMSVEEICSMMTYEEAGNVIVSIGTCKDWTLSQVADRRPASLKWYINGYQGSDNILRAAATIMQASLDERKAS